MEGSRSHPGVSSSVEVTTHPTNLLLPPARAQRYLRSADPAAQGFHRPLQNMLWGRGGGMGHASSRPCCSGQCLPATAGGS